MNAAVRVHHALDAMVAALADLDPLAADDQADHHANRMALDERRGRARAVGRG